jgi:hypothetical protein
VIEADGLTLTLGLTERVGDTETDDVMESELLCVTETDADSVVVVEGDEELEPNGVLDTTDDCDGLALTEAETVVEGLRDELNEPEVEPDPVSDTEAVLVLDRL